MKKIIIIDNEMSYLNSINRILREKNDYSLLILKDCSNLDEKLAQETADLIIIDLKMQYFCGFALITYIRNKLRMTKTKILAMSGSILERDFQKAIELGADDFIAKPFTKEELIKKVSNLID